MPVPASHWLITSDVADSAGGTTPPPVQGAPRPPNPAETIWTLGDGGVAVTPSVVAGFQLVLVTALRNNGQALDYDPEDQLEAVVWRGRDASNLFFPTVAWLQADQGTLQLVVLADDTAALEPGRYAMRVGLTVDGSRFLAYDGGLEVVAATGSDASRTPYVTGADLLFYYDQLPQLQNYEVDEAAFLDQRADASSEFDRLLINRYAPRAGYIKIRNPAFHPDLGYDVPDPSIVPPTKAQLTSWLAAGGLVVDHVAREILCRMALALILDRQETEGQNPYRDEAQIQRDRAGSLWADFQAQIDINGDRKPDWLIGMDATQLPEGAAP